MQYFYLEVFDNSFFWCNIILPPYIFKWHNHMPLYPIFRHVILYLKPFWGLFRAIYISINEYFTNGIFNTKYYTAKHKIQALFGFSPKSELLVRSTHKIFRMAIIKLGCCETKIGNDSLLVDMHFDIDNIDINADNLVDMF